MAWVYLLAGPRLCVSAVMGCSHTHDRLALIPPPLQRFSRACAALIQELAQLDSSADSETVSSVVSSEVEQIEAAHGLLDAPYYHGLLSRIEACILLSHPDMVDQSYLLRYEEVDQFPEFTISMRRYGKVVHIPIDLEDKVYIDNLVFQNMSDFLTYHFDNPVIVARKSHGCLRYPVDVLSSC
eukprot:m.104344 g.104344  ORF g.104344 m.104344 type:complete len:183 (-) comp9101_c0_seq1:394-942(-)